MNRMLGKMLNEYEDKGIFGKCAKAIKQGGELIKIKPSLSKAEQKYIDDKKRRRKNEGK